MDAANYTDLLSTISQYLNRDDLTDQIPLFISLFEAKANRTIRTNNQLTQLAGNITAGTSTISVPADFLSPLTFTVQNTNSWNWYTIQFINEYEANKRRQQQNWLYLWGASPWYTIFGNTIEIVGMQPSTTAIPYTLRYYQAVTPLSNSNQTNWLLTASPDLYIYGAMLEAEAFLMNDERLPIWKAAHDMIITDMKVASDNARFPVGGKHVTWRTFG